jgi:hypothetical protein
MGLEDMLAAAARFYGPSIDFAQVTVRVSRVALGGRPWTAGNTIRLADSATSQATVIHELAHVWQYQSGNLQLLRGLIEQIGYQLGRNPYDYGGAAGVRAAVSAGTPLTSFRNECQAQIVEDYWSAVHVPGATGYLGEAYAPAYVEDLRTIVEEAGIGTRAPGGASRVETAVGWIVNAVAGQLERRPQRRPRRRGSA